MKKLLSTWGSLHGAGAGVVILLIINFLVYEQVSRPFPTNLSPKHSDSLRNLSLEERRTKVGTGGLEACGSVSLVDLSLGTGGTALSLRSVAYVLNCGRLFASPWTVCSLPGSSVHSIFQARILEWVAISFSSDQLLSDHKYIRAIWNFPLVSWGRKSQSYTSK